MFDSGIHVIILPWVEMQTRQAFGMAVHEEVSMGIKSFVSNKRLIRDQRGITGLETAIVLIAFVVVA